MTDLFGNGEVGFKQSTSWAIYHETEIEGEKDHSQSKLTLDNSILSSSRTLPQAQDEPVTDGE